MLEKNTSEAGSVLEFVGVVISFRTECSEVIASMSLSGKRADKLLERAQKLGAEGGCRGSPSPKISLKSRFPAGPYYGTCREGSSEADSRVHSSRGWPAARGSRERPGMVGGDPTIHISRIDHGLLTIRGPSPGASI